MGIFRAIHYYRTLPRNTSCPWKSRTHGHLVTFAFGQILLRPFYRLQHVFSANHSWCWHWTGDRLEWWTINRCVGISVSFPLQTIIWLTKTQTDTGRPTVLLISKISRNIFLTLSYLFHTNHNSNQNRPILIYRLRNDLYCVEWDVKL